MKILIVISCAAVAYARLCVYMDPKICNHKCPPGETKICEHSVCGCGPECMQKDDCPKCPSVIPGLKEVRHCVDNGCVCHPDF